LNWRLWGFLMGVVMLSACATGPRIHIDDAWARPAQVGLANDVNGTHDMPGMPGSGTNGVVYFVIANDGGGMDTLLRVDSLVSSSTEIHETRLEGDIARMDLLPLVDIPAHARIEFKPGSYHLMLIGLLQDLKAGDSLQISLQFEKSGTIIVEVPIREQ